MTEYLSYLIFVGAAVQMIGVFFYIKETLKGNTRPNKVTWLLWAIAPLIAAFAAISDGVKWSVLPVFVAGLGPLLIFLASFVNKKSYWKLEKIDYACGIFSVLSLILWWITKEPIVAIIFSILSDALAAIPTVVKSWKYPETENVNNYAACLFNALTSFSVIKTFNFTEIAFPIYLVLINAILVIAVLRKKFSKIK